MLDIFLKTLSTFIDKNLSALLIGCIGTLLFLFQYWKLPEKWDKFINNLEEIENDLKLIEDRLVKIETRQYRILDFIAYNTEKSNKLASPNGEPDSTRFDQ